MNTEVKSLHTKGRPLALAMKGDNQSNNCLQPGFAFWMFQHRSYGHDMLPCMWE